MKKAMRKRSLLAVLLVLYLSNLRRKSHNRIKCLEILKSSLKIKVCRHFSTKGGADRILDS